MEGYSPHKVVIDEVKAFFGEIAENVENLELPDSINKEITRKAYLHRKAVEKRKKRKRGGPK